MTCTNGRFASWPLQLLAAAACIAGAPRVAPTIDYGKPGGPVKLVVGYQPYYTQSWSGVVMRGKKFYEKYLPKGSKVEFQIGLQGAIIVNNMLAGKQHIGYMGDMPAIVSTTKTGRRRRAARREPRARLRPVQHLPGAQRRAAVQERPGSDQVARRQDRSRCRRAAAPTASRRRRSSKENVQPKEYLNQNIEVITSNFRAGKLDAAVIWEPTASRLVQEGLARRVATGASVQENDGGFLAMRADLIKQRPDVVKAWLKAELDAQLFLADPKNAHRGHQDGEGADHRLFRDACCGTRSTARYPDSEGGGRRCATRCTTPSRPRRVELINARDRVPVLDQEHQRREAAARGGHAASSPRRS